MATQAQRRGEAISALRRLRQEYRKADTAGERTERELDRLIKRKTLIGPDELEKLAQTINVYIRLGESVQKLYAIIYQIVANLPR